MMNMHMKRGASFLLLLVLAWGSLLFHDSSSTAQAALTSDQIYSKIEPSVLRIGVEVSADLIIPEANWDWDKGGYVPTEKILREPMTAQFLGTGFVVNSEGYIVTNAHVVDVKEQTTRDYFWQEYARELYDYIQDQGGGLEDWWAIFNYVERYAKIENVKHKISVFRPEVKEGSFEDLFARGHKAELTKLGQPFPEQGKDVAVIKIDKSNMQSLPLGDGSGVKQGQRVFVLGYPAIADLNESSLTRPTYTTGIVSAIKRSSQGDYDVVQIDAAISGGNSGGPVVDEYGNVIGIATFGAVESQGYNFILPIKLAKEYLVELGIDYTKGKIPLFQGNMLVWAVAGLALLVVVLLVVVIVVLKKRKLQPVMAPVPTPITATPPAAVTVSTQKMVPTQLSPPSVSSLVAVSPSAPIA